MAFKVYTLDQGMCTCVVGDPNAGSKRANVRKLSATGVLLEPTLPLRNKQFVYTSLVLADGPSQALSGVVVTTTAEGLFIKWEHSKPGDADRLDRTIRDYLLRKGKLPLFQEPPARPPAAPGAGPAGKPRAEVPGKLDVDATIRKRARTVLSADLASRMQTVQVLGIGTIKSLIREAVEESAALLGQTLNEEERRRLLEEAEGTFREKYEAEKAGLEEKSKLLEKQLKRAQGLLEEERQKVLTASQFTVSDTGMVQLEQRLGRMLDRALVKGQVTDELEQDMRAVVSRLLDDEREKIRQQAQDAQNDRMQLLEKKVQRLAESLKVAEGERDRAQRLAQALEAAGGLHLKNLYTAGMDLTDPDRERKLSLLKEIVNQNKKLREELAAQGLLPALMRPRSPVPAVELAAKAAPAKGEEPPEPEEPAEPDDDTTELETDESSIAESLGVRKSEPEPAAEKAMAVEEESPHAGEKAPEDDTDEVEVPVLAEGGEVNPDDLPWEPEKPGEDDPQNEKFRKLK